MKNLTKINECSNGHWILLLGVHRPRAGLSLVEAQHQPFLHSPILCHKFLETSIEFLSISRSTNKNDKAEHALPSAPAVRQTFNFSLTTMHLLAVMLLLMLCLNVFRNQKTHEMRGDRNWADELKDLLKFFECSLWWNFSLSSSPRMSPVGSSYCSVDFIGRFQST